MYFACEKCQLCRRRHNTNSTTDSYLVKSNIAGNSRTLTTTFAHPSDKESNDWIYLPQLLSLKVDQVVAKYRKHVRVAEVKLNQAEVQEVPEEQLRTFEAGFEREKSQHTFSMTFNKKTFMPHVPNTRYQKDEKDIFSNRAGNRFFKMVVNAKDFIDRFDTYEGQGGLRHIVASD